MFELVQQHSGASAAAGAGSAAPGGPRPLLFRLEWYSSFYAAQGLYGADAWKEGSEAFLTPPRHPGLETAGLSMPVEGRWRPSSEDLQSRQEALSCIQAAVCKCLATRSGVRRGPRFPCPQHNRIYRGQGAVREGGMMRAPPTRIIDVVCCPQRRR